MPDVAAEQWHAVILAAGRGPEDPMAKAFGVSHKCTLPVAGVPMLKRVVEALRATAIARPFRISIDDASAAAMALSGMLQDVALLASGKSAPASAISAIQDIGTFPVLITTGDHALLTPEMINHLLTEAARNKADVSVGLATKDVISAAYPETRRTYFNLGGTRVSGCNLFAVTTRGGLRMMEAWQDLERNRKKPWKLVAAFGLAPLFSFITGRLTPERAFGFVSRKLGITVKPVFLPYAEAAMDVDKPSDHVLAEAILLKRSAPA